MYALPDPQPLTLLVWNVRHDLFTLKPASRINCCAAQDNYATSNAYLITMAQYPHPATTVQLTSMSYKRGFHTSAVTPGGQIYIFGGQVCPSRGACFSGHCRCMLPATAAEQCFDQRRAP